MKPYGRTRQTWCYCHDCWQCKRERIHLKKWLKKKARQEGKREIREEEQHNVHPQNARQ